MARIQVLELPATYRPDGVDETPFVVVIDQAAEGTVQALAINGEPGAAVPLAERIGARAILLFEETVEIPANDVPIGPDGYPVRLRVEGDFEQFRQQVQEEIAKALSELTSALSADRRL